MINKILILLFCFQIIQSLNEYEEYQFLVQCPQCISSFQNHTIIGDPYESGLLKLSIIVNISSVEGYESSGYISAFIVPNYPSSEQGYVLNVLSNNTEFFNKNKTYSCSGDVPYTYGCTSTSSNWCSLEGYAPIIIYPMGSYENLKFPQVLELNKTTQININCNRTNILQNQISQSYLPTSGVLMYNHTIDLIRNSEIFRASYLLDTMNYPHFYLDFYSRMNYNNKLYYQVYLKIDYAIKYDSVAIKEGISFL